MLRPLNDSVVVEPIKTPEASIGGITLPDASRSKYHGLRAVVVAVGPGVLTLSGARVPIMLTPGEVVVLRHNGPMIRDGGRLLSVVQERDVLCAIPDAGFVETYSPAEMGLSQADE